jgi:hypothetical protein
MQRLWIDKWIVASAIAAALTGCGGEDPGSNGGSSKGPLLPWAEGNSWTYDVTDAMGVKTQKVTTVGAAEPVGGSGPNAALMAFKIVTEKGVMDETISWQGVVGDKVVRYREQAFGATSGMLSLEEHWDPYKLHVDGSAERTAAGVSWLEIYEETKITNGSPITAEARDRWTVISASERVEVPAGTFDAVVLQKVGGSSKTYWYVRGVGKVKETGGQTEELVDYTVAP